MFLSVEFWAAFTAFILVFALLKRRTEVGMMLWVIAFSLAFLLRANGILMLILPAVTVVTWAFARWLRRCSGAARKRVLALSIVVALSPLAYFKYAGFTIDTLNDILRTNFPIGKILLPAGLSFYSFQAVSYLMDVYRERFTDDVDLLHYAFYQTFFPVLLCGPITRSTVFFPQIAGRKDTSKELLWGGVFLFIVGMLKKGAFADYLAQYNNLIFDDPGGYSGFENLMGALGYTFQIYLDFSGYSDMAIGIAAVMGFSLPENFNYPYRSLNVADFWRRWHIALSSWFKDYLYIPMGGNRKGALRTYFNNFFTMLVSGLWHGASWMFVLWGCVHGVGLVISKLFKPLTDRLPDRWYARAPRVLLCFIFVMLAWVFFRSPDMGCCKTVFSKIFTETTLDYVAPFFTARTLWCAVLLLCAVMSLLPAAPAQKAKGIFIKMPLICKIAVFALALQLMFWLNHGSVAPLLYADF